MNIKSAFIQFCRDEEGASGIEYALIAAMVAIVLVNFVPGISGAISTIFGDIETALVGTP